MHLLFEVTHPAHVHCFKNVIFDLKKRGHQVLIVAKDKEMTLKLLDSYSLKYEVIGSNHKAMIRKAIGLLISDYKLYNVAKHFKPDILVGRGSPTLAHLSLLIRKPYIALIDTENAHLISFLSAPFARAICASDSYNGRISKKKEVRFRGYKELLYLHPNRFNPDPQILSSIGLSKSERFIVVRFVGWGATHDIGDRGFSDHEILIHELEKYRRVFISSELDLPYSLQKYRITVPPEMIHSLLYYADLFIGESATMATESAVLGVPSIFVSSSKRGYTNELETKYDLVYNYSPYSQKEAIAKAIEILKADDSKLKWREKLNVFYKDKEDVATFMVNYIESYYDKH